MSELAVDAATRALLERIERYYDAVPRPHASVEEVGPFTLYVSNGGWPYYARPRRGLDVDVTVDDVVRVRARQRALGVPESIEWTQDVTPSLRAAAAASGLAVQDVPLLALQRPLDAPARHDVLVRVVDGDDDVRASVAVADVGFRAGGTDVGAVGSDAVRAAMAEVPAGRVEHLRARVDAGWTVQVLASDASGPVATGAHQPVDDVSEVVGVATVPAARRRGLAAAVTAALVAHARRRGVDVVFLTAGSDDVARVYERVGFRRVGTGGIAEVGDEV